jgi:two-component system OmpR family response regulator
MRAPVLVLTARSTWSEKVKGLRAGADDYLAKPFHMEELVARVEALIRRDKGNVSTLLTCGEVQLDTATGQVTRRGEAGVLTALEHRLLTYLLHRAGAIVSKAELTEHIYDQSFDKDSNVIEVLVNRLRKKFGADFIKTRRGLGYIVDDA